LETKVKSAFMEARRDAGVVALVGGTIIDGTGRAPIKDGVVIIAGARIGVVGDRSTPVPPDAKEIPVSGKFIIPGFCASTLLISDYFGVATLIRFEGRYDELALEAAQIALQSGITTVFEAYGPRDDLIKLRTAINDGKAIGPRIYLCGGWIGCDGPFSADQNNSYTQALAPDVATRINARWECNVAGRLTSMSASEVRGEIRRYIDTGVDYLRVLVNVHRYVDGAHRFFQFSPRVLGAIVDEAHRSGLVVHGNCMYSEEGVWTALDAGIDLPELAFMSRPLSTDLVELLARRQVTWSIDPFRRQEMEWFERRLKNETSEWTRANKSMVEDKPLNERAVLRAGVPVMLSMGGFLLSADSLNHPIRKTGVPGDRMLLGKQHFNTLLGAQDIGMKPMEALQAATRNVARAYRVDQDLGTLERGKFADLLILDRNPLEDAENYRSIGVVMKAGKFIDREALPTQRLLSAPPLEQGRDRTCR
jgi:imidazolonepropionase-like amidohydrolase